MASIEVDQDRLLRTFLELVGVDSFHGREDSVAELLTGYLEPLGVEFRRDPIGNLIGVWDGGSDDRVPIMLNAHMDTIRPTEGMRPEVRDGAVYSDGSSVLGADDKAGLAAIVEAMRAVGEAGHAHGPVELVFTVGEEVGHVGSRAFDLTGVQSRRAFVMDSTAPVGGIVTRASGRRELRAAFTGAAAHAGAAPELGVSAIAMAAHAIARMPLGRIDADTVANIGTIAGGQADNIVAPEARYLFASRRVVEPYREARDDFAIFRGIARELGVESEYTEDRDVEEWLRHLYDVTRQRASERAVEMPSFDDFRARGVFKVPDPERPVVMLEAFRSDPEANPLHTPSGRIEIFSERIDGFGYEDCRGHPRWYEPCEWLGGAGADLHPLHLISNQPVTRLHSQLDNGRHSRAGKIDGREPVAMHPADAAARGIAAGDAVRVFNDRGACLSSAGGERGHPPRRCPAFDRRVVRSGDARRARCHVQAREPERAHAGQGHVEACAGTHRAHVPGRGRAVRWHRTGGDRVRAAGDRLAPIHTPTLRAASPVSSVIAMLVE